jgi:drug/metabolite transporter (DMT)-like permease
MTLFALALLLVAAVLHATWNYWAKKAGGGLAFVYLTGLMINAGYLVVVSVYWVMYDPSVSWVVVRTMLVSGILKTGYSLYLQRGYRSGDFSLIYPLARGTGPLLSTLSAIAFLGERPSALAIGGGAVIIGSIFFLTGGARWFRSWIAREKRAEVSDVDKQEAWRSVRYGIMSGMFIAAYTLWDRHGVADRKIPPVLFDAGTALTQLCLLTPFAWHRRGEVVREWREHRLNAFLVATLSPLAYILVLTALSFTAVSYVAPAREVSILIGTFLGAKYLKEVDARRRLWAAAAMVLGIMALALG